jgi:RHS repeat-associated protein
VPWSHLFQGLKLTEITSLFYVRHRDYSASLGRFIERDPIGFEAGDNNWYRFVGNEPLTTLDPSGLAVLPPRPCTLISPMRVLGKVHVVRAEAYGGVRASNSAGLNPVTVGFEAVSELICVREVRRDVYFRCASVCGPAGRTLPAADIPITIQQVDYYTIPRRNTQVGDVLFAGGIDIPIPTGKVKIGPNLSIYTILKSDLPKAHAACKRALDDYRLYPVSDPPGTKSI